MSGRLEETAFANLKEQQQSSQASLSEYCNESETYIAVVSEPRRGIENYVDEVWYSLGMPSWALKKFLARRSGYRGNSAIDDPHNQAYVDMNLRSIYQSHLQNSDKAQSRISDATERLTSGENITLVCYETGGDKCHRHLLIDEISKRVESRENSKFKLSA
jgi:hypothetical protein